MKLVVTVTLFFPEVAVDFGLLKVHCFLFNCSVKHPKRNPSVMTVLICCLAEKVFFKITPLAKSTSIKKETCGQVFSLKGSRIVLLI